ncbi:MAG TPA: DNA repair protein RadC [Candidatus Aphodocola excrementigallinarum]|uniref:DNA repair protein RadC n=1 Tax=Candidatus Aphodocola excrementigallinarum TaxID=2840670 RepID=A0A9D1LI76_9FIRM|nr:DNA repair protein RadC [Candidatus Aphodocola excrementigallinarum]
MSNVLIKDVPQDERPRERLVKYGAKNLSTSDLIAIILKTGTRDYSSKYLASEVLKLVKDVSDLKKLSLSKLISINGIGAVKAIEFLAALELGRRVYESKPLENDLRCNSAHKIFDHFKSEFSGVNQEYFYCLYLNSQKKLIDKKLLFKGTLNKSLIHPREVFKEAYLSSAAYIICVHNHPSGNVIPSNDDINITNTLVEIGYIQKIPVIDHIIIGENNYYSFYENGLIEGA